MPLLPESQYQIIEQLFYTDENGFLFLLHVHHLLKSGIFAHQIQLCFMRIITEHHEYGETDIQEMEEVSSLLFYPLPAVHLLENVFRIIQETDPKDFFLIASALCSLIATIAEITYEEICLQEKILTAFTDHLKMNASNISDGVRDELNIGFHMLQHKLINDFFEIDIISQKVLIQMYREIIRNIVELSNCLPISIQSSDWFHDLSEQFFQLIDFHIEDIDPKNYINRSREFITLR